MTPSSELIRIADSSFSKSNNKKLEHWALLLRHFEGKLAADLLCIWWLSRCQNWTSFAFTKFAERNLEFQISQNKNVAHLDSNSDARREFPKQAWNRCPKCYRQLSCPLSYLQSIQSRFGNNDDPAYISVEARKRPESENYFGHRINTYSEENGALLQKRKLFDSEFQKWLTLGRKWPINCLFQFRKI